MKRISFLSSLFFAAIISSIASATIINIPDDYTAIQEGINASSDSDTVLVSPGAYPESVNFNGKNIVLASLFLITSNPIYIESTIIYNNLTRSERRVNFASGEDSTAAVIGFTIEGSWAWQIAEGGIACSYNSNPVIAFNVLKNCVAESGSGIYCWQSNPQIYNNIFINNLSGMIFNFGDGAAIMIVNSNPIISANIFYSCYAERNGGAIYCNGSNPLIQNNVFIENEAEIGGAIYLDNSNPRLINNVLWNNAAQDGMEIFVASGSNPMVMYNNIEGGWEGEGNIDVDPLFRDPDNGDFHLMAIECGDPYDSPCIDMGHPGIIDTLLSCDWGLGTERSDMGAYSGGEGAVDIDEPILSVPQKTSLSQNYPNPFNASTMIKYDLPQQSQVTIEIYDILGRKVSTLTDKQQPAGYHQAIWRADDFASGMYFYKLQAGDYIETKKMLLLR